MLRSCEEKPFYFLLEFSYNMQNDPANVSVILERFRRTQDLHQAAADSYAKRKQPTNDEDDAAHDAQNEVPNSKKIKIVDTIEAEGLSAIPQPAQTDADKNAVTLEWPVKPRFVDPDARKSFKSLGVSKHICDHLESLGFTDAFAVQTVVIPSVLESQTSVSPDPLPTILVNSFTGSGKTMAYMVPIVDVLSTNASRGTHRVRALILLPTKVLMSQVHSVAEQLSKGTGLRVQTLKAGRSLTREARFLQEDVPDIIVSAPGRLVDHVRLQPNLLKDLKFLVVDEADRLVGQSFQNWTKLLQEVVPTPTHANVGQIWRRPPQRLIFSATLTRDPAKLAELQVSMVPTKPKLFIVGNEDLDGNDEFALPQQLTERLLVCSGIFNKPLALVNELISSGHLRYNKTVVFVRNNESASRLSRLIELVSSNVFGFPIRANKCSGEMRVQERKKILKEFETNENGLLVCTDLIARGIDMPIDCVVNYDVPYGVREYVHRVGRTARANAEGTAVTIVTHGRDRQHFYDIQVGISRSNEITEEEPTYDINEEKYNESLQALEKEVINDSKGI